ncbi:MAG: hypothetical protein K0S01_382 [Herbinix sp.]|jgi:cytoskeletal protein CcmA (bactofilin family)|nr:hypothetical protein [Herbinix sp.]
MQNYVMEGVGKISGGEFDTITVKGVGTCSDNIKAENIHIEGVFNCSGEVATKLLHCAGASDFKSNIRAKKITIGGVLSQKEGTKIEAEEIICEGLLKTGGEISADIIEADGCIVAKEIYGDQITIKSYYRAKRIVNFFTGEKSEVKLIEATTIVLKGVTADIVNGRDITIEANCSIDKIDCSGVLYIDKSSTVNTITGNYLMRE